MKRITAALLVIIMIFSLAACHKEEPPVTSGNATQGNAPEIIEGVEDGVLTVAMECAYPPYNWSQPDRQNGGIRIKGTKEYANGYDVMMAKKICEENGWKLEIIRTDWKSLISAVQTGKADAAIAGQSMTEERMEKVDFAGPYLYAEIVCLTDKDSDFAKAVSIAELSEGKCTSRINTIWYDRCLPQIEKAEILPAVADTAAMLEALKSGSVDFICTDVPTAQAAVLKNADFSVITFEAGKGFSVDDGDTNIGISVRKGNTSLKDAIDMSLAGMTSEDFNTIMEKAIAIQPDLTTK